MTTNTNNTNNTNNEQNMDIKHIRSGRTKHSVSYTFEVDGVEKTVSGSIRWTRAQAREYVANLGNVEKALAACIASPDNFIGQSYRDTFGS